MAEWVIEHGIGEHRALLLEGDEALAAKLLWPGALYSGQVIEAKLVAKRAGSKRGIAQRPSGVEILIDDLPSFVSEGEQIHAEIKRSPIAERGRLKRAIGKFADSRAVDEIQSRGIVPGDMQGFRFPMMGIQQVRQLSTGQFLNDQWDEIWHAASSASIAFAGGEILLSVTPAMTVIDIDGDLSPRELALAAIPAIAKAIKWFDLGGNIGIDFPTIEAKAERKSVDAALDKALDDWPHERTAMNGFGFVQVVARLEGPSLLHRFATSRVGMCARMALRQAERTSGLGTVLLLTVHPALKAKLRADWIEELSRRTGKQVRIATDPGLALETPSAQIVPE